MFLTLALSAFAQNPRCDRRPVACIREGNAAFADGDLSRAKRLLDDVCTLTSVQYCGHLLHHFGLGQSVVDQAIQWCQLGNGVTCGRLGWLFLLQAPEPLRDRERALWFYEKGCDFNIGWSCAGAAAALTKGETRDLKRVAAFNERACTELKHHESCVHLAEQKIDGRGVEADPRGANRLLLNSCYRGSGVACERAGYWADSGRAMAPDRARASELYGRACQAGRAWSCGALGRSYAAHPTPKGAEALTHACRSGVQAACVALLILDGDGVDSFPRAVKRARRHKGWAHAACAAGHRPGCLAWSEQTDDPVLAAQARVAALPRINHRVPEFKVPFVPPPADLRRCIDAQLAQFADPELLGRGPGEDGQRIAADRLVLAFEALEMEVERSPVLGSSDNITATWPGVGALAGERVLVGAHYDHLGTDEDGVVHPGADDNASGVAAMVCAAEAIREQLGSNTNRRTLVFIGFTAEELGSVGSAQWVKEHALDGIVGMVNLDMIGNLRDDRLLMDTDATGWEPLVARAASAAGLEVQHSPTQGRSDHAPFAVESVPAVHLFTGEHGNYHRPTDTLDRLNVPGAVRVTQTVSALRSLAEKPTGLSVSEQVCTHPFLGPLRFGVSMDTLRRTIDGDFKNLPVRCVEKNGPAAAIGLEPGDVIVSMPNTERWPMPRIRLQVLRDEKCLDLAAGTAPKACDTRAMEGG